MYVYILYICTCLFLDVYNGGEDEHAEAEAQRYRMVETSRVLLSIILI